MRPDMGKVVTERPRHGMRIKRPKGYYRKMHKIALEDQPKHEPMDLHGYDGKGFTDVLGPLRGYVLSVVGRPFDQVYAEIKRSLPGSNMSVRHVLGHLWYFLERQVIIDEQGRPCHANRDYMPYDSKWPMPIEFRKYGPIAYVDPRDNIIKRAPARKYPKPEKKPKTVVWKDGRLYEKLEGIWYEIQYRPYTKVRRPVERIPGRYYFYNYTEEIIGGYDVVLGEHVRTLNEYQLKDAHGKSGIFAEKKTQLNSREIRRLGLRE